MYWEFTLKESTYDICLKAPQQTDTPVDDAVRDAVGFFTGDPNPHGLVHVVDNEENHVITLNIPEQEV